MKKELLKIIVKVLIYALTLVAGYLGVSAMVACTVNRSIQSSGRGVGIFHYSDTFNVEHGNTTKITIK